MINAALIQDNLMAANKRSGKGIIRYSPTGARLMHISLSSGLLDAGHISGRRGIVAWRTANVERREGCGSDEGKPSTNQQIGHQ